MVTDEQVRRLMKYIQKEKTYGTAAAKVGMEEKTARKYRDLGKLPSDIQSEHNWRSRKDRFYEVCDEVRSHLQIHSCLEAKTLFKDLQRRYPRRFSDGQLRSLQRCVKMWRALEGPPKEVFFPQKHKPGVLCQLDFTHMSSLGAAIGGHPLKHVIYHFVLPYSN